MGTKGPVKCKEKTSIKKEPASTLTDNGSLFKSKECFSYIWYLVRDNTDLGKWGKAIKVAALPPGFSALKTSRQTHKTKIYSIITRSQVLQNPARDVIQSLPATRGKYPPHFTANISLLQLFEVLTASRIYTEYTRPNSVQY